MSRNRRKRIDKTKTRDAKRIRKENVFEKLRKDEQVKRNERKKKFGVYQSGINMEDPDGPEVFAWVKSPKKKRSKKDQEAVICKHCGLAGHSRTSSRQCLKHKKGTDTPVAEDPVDPVDSEEDAAEDVEQYETLQAHLQRHALEDANNDLARNKSNDSDKDSEVQELHVL
jgi:hypothetical protein